jgi:hypothetical protein
MEQPKTQWSELIGFLKSRKVKFKKFPLFYIYLFIVVILVGGFSVWASIFIEIKNCVFNHQNVCLSLMGFSLPITTAFAIDLFKMDAEDFIKHIFQVICVAIPLVLIVLFVVYIHSYWAYLFSGLNVVLSLFFWWIINSKNTNLCDETYYKVIEDGMAKHNKNNKWDDDESGK